MTRAKDIFEHQVTLGIEATHDTEMKGKKLGSWGDLWIIAAICKPFVNSNRINPVWNEYPDVNHTFVYKTCLENSDLAQSDNHLILFMLV